MPQPSYPAWVLVHSHGYVHQLLVEGSQLLLGCHVGKTHWLMMLGANTLLVVAIAWWWDRPCMRAWLSICSRYGLMIRKNRVEKQHQVGVGH